MVIRKQKNYMNTYDIVLEKENKKFIMTFQGNLDLYLLLVGKNKNKESFEITKENHVIYEAFEKLYDDIKYGNVFQSFPRTTSENEAEEEWNLESLDEEETRIKEMNENLIKQRKYEEKPIFKNNKIEWYCDDEPYDKASVLTIEKQDDRFIISIKDKNKSHIFNGVRIRNNGSRYQPYNIVFMRLFNELQNYDPNYHQMHIDELEYQKKLQLKR